MSFGKELDDVVKNIQPDTEANSSDVSEANEALKTGLPPSYVIDSAWRTLEQKLSQTATTPEPHAVQPPSRSAEPIADGPQLPPEIPQLVQDLRHLRDRAVHGDQTDITSIDALRF